MVNASSDAHYNVVSPIRARNCEAMVAQQFRTALGVKAHGADSERRVRATLRMPQDEAPIS
jgi:hypothetical protein